jgi:type VI protein secretion system component VasF
VAHLHVHVPHALTETPEPAPRRRMERRLELGAVVLFALTTLATAWCGYQAARWRASSIVADPAVWR